MLCCKQCLGKNKDCWAAVKTDRPVVLKTHVTAAYPLLSIGFAAWLGWAKAISTIVLTSTSVHRVVPSMLVVETAIFVEATADLAFATALLYKISITMKEKVSTNINARKLMGILDCS